MYFCIVDDTNYDDAYCIHENVCVCCTLYKTRWRKMILKYGLWFCIAQTLHNHYTYGDWRWGFFSFAGWVFFGFVLSQDCFLRPVIRTEQTIAVEMCIRCTCIALIFLGCFTWLRLCDMLLWFGSFFLRCNSSLFYLVGWDLDFCSIWSVEMVCFSSLSLFLGVNEHPLSPPSLLDYVLASLCG